MYKSMVPVLVILNSNLTWFPTVTPFASNEILTAVMLMVFSTTVTFLLVALVTLSPLNPASMEFATLPSEVALKYNNTVDTSSLVNERTNLNVFEVSLNTQSSSVV